MARVAELTVVLADPLRPRLANQVSAEFLYWGNLLANLWGLRGLYNRHAQHHKLQRFDQVLRLIQKEGTRALPQYRTEMMIRQPYLVEELIADAGTELAASQEAGWWVGAAVAAFELSRAYGLALGLDDRLARGTAQVWVEVSHLAYRSIPDELATSILRQVSSGRAHAPENAWDLVKERMVGP